MNTRCYTFARENAPQGELWRKFFQEVPDWNTAYDKCLYMPMQFNYANFGGATLHITSRKPNKAHLYLIQVTIAMEHKNFEVAFCRDQWSKWVEDLIENGWDLKSTSIWIDRKEAEESQRAQVTKIPACPHYTRWRTGFTSIDSRFGRVEI
jgi:hypothetical protein